MITLKFIKTCVVHINYNITVILISSKLHVWHIDNKYFNIPKIILLQVNIYF